MNDDLKKILAVAVCVFLAAMAVYGSYLPYRKSGYYIDAIRAIQGNKIDSLESFEKTLELPFEAGGPIGQNEIVRNSSNYVTSLIKANGKMYPVIVDPLIDFLRKYYDPILDTPQGMSFGQDLLLMGTVYENAFLATNNPKYLKGAIYFLEKARELGPNRPQSLLALFDMYRLAGDKKNAIEVGENILTLWPKDASTQRLLEELKGGAGAKK